MSTESNKALFDADPVLRTRVLQVAANVPTATDEDVLLTMLIEVEEGDIFMDTARHLGFYPMESTLVQIVDENVPVEET